MEIRLAKPEEFEQIRKLYWDIIDKGADDPSFPQWEKGVHPSDELITKSIENSQLYAAVIQAPAEDSLDIYDTVPRIAGAMIMCRPEEQIYKNAAWEVEAGDNEVIMLKVLGIAPDQRKKGIAKAMISYAVQLADDYGIKALRLDVIDNNRAAEELYTRLGFKYIQTVDIERSIGVRSFKLFELSII